jgi:hypothetical protein
MLPVGLAVQDDLFQDLATSLIVMATLRTPVYDTQSLQRQPLLREAAACSCGEGIPVRMRKTTVITQKHSRATWRK